MELTPPHDEATEMAVLGAMMVDRDSLIVAADRLGPKAFYLPAHQTIFAAVLELHAGRRPADIVSVANLLRGRGSLDEVGGAAYLAELVNSVYTTANLDHHVEIVAEKARLRKLANLCRKVIGDITAGEMEAAEIIDGAQASMLQIGRKRSATVATLGSLAADVYEHATKRYDGDVVDEGKPTGYYDLDEMLGGLQPGNLVILAARPSMGKTAFALNLATHVAMTQPKPVVIFSLEMGKEQLAQRVLSAESGVNHIRVRHGQMNDVDWSRLAGTVGKLADLPVWIDDQSSPTVSEIISQCRRIAAEEGELGLVVIDYLQLINGGGSNKATANREQEVSKISRALKGLSKDLKVPVVSLSQLSRAVEARTNKRPQLSDLRESGSIEQDADVVMFIYRDDYYHPESDEAGVAEVIIAKHRNGPVGTVKLRFDKALTKFQNLSLQGGVA